MNNVAQTRNDRSPFSIVIARQFDKMISVNRTAGKAEKVKEIVAHSALAQTEKESTEDKFRSLWIDKTITQIEREILSWHKYMNRHNAAYNLHGGNMTPPGCLADGDKVLILREILRERQFER